MKITELTPKELGLLDQILKYLAAYNLDVVKEPEKLKVKANGDFDFERLKNYCLEIGITLKVFDPKNAKAGYIYLQPWPTNMTERSGTDGTDFSYLYEEFFGARVKK